MPSFVITLFLIASSTHINGDYTPWQFSVGLASLCIPIAVYLSKRMGLLFGCFSGYFLIHAVSSASNFHASNSSLPVQLQNQISIAACFSLMYALIIFLGVFLMDDGHRKKMRGSIGILVVSNSLYVISSKLTGFRLPGGNGASGIIDYCGMNGSFLAIGFSLLIPSARDTTRELRIKIVSMLSVFTAIVLSASAIPFGILGMVVASSLFTTVKKRKWLVVLPLLVALSAGYFTVGSKMTDSSRRFEAYRVFMSFLKNEKKMILGTGLGSLPVYAPTAQSRKNFMIGEKNIWLWDKLHSDFLQLWVEMGLVAFVLSIVIYFQCLFSAYKSRDSHLLSMGVGIGCAACLNYPMHIFITALVATWFLVECLKRAPGKTCT